MDNYIDGFVLPIPRSQLEQYKSLVQAVAEIWKEHGALAYRECVGDDMAFTGTRSFTSFAAAADTEVVIFGWVEFESRAARDLANQKVAADPRMSSLLESSNSGFDATRMVYGGFLPLVSS